ncbi:hypothetical protein NP233_g3947 [Leucocoprinus birnbaumii]|uniref:LYC1 C-terminal domain-containing protein n=1 Tax=Leucocoprinus birnbaumii TaxID=56174 RepID=A0AAD5VZD7_9AGAR|nr:hypothetical protein NP233_g3947 [Leucocoprinus birnbaumii]
MLLSELTLYPATREQTIASWKRTAVEWGTGLTLEEYIDREFVGEKEEFARDGKQITWVLVPRTDPTTLDFCCSCETFKRRIAIARPSKSGGDKTSPLEHGYGYGIASVFTPSQNRGKGYAKHMMRLLHWVLAPEDYLSTHTFPGEWGIRPVRVPNAGDASVSALWSDVGPTFYQGCGMTIGSDGWVARDPISNIWNVHSLDLSGYEEEENVTWLGEQSIKALWEKDAAQIENEIAQRARNEGQVKTQFSFLPNEGVADFQWFRLNYHFSRYVSNPPQYCGLRVGKGDAFATWICDYRTEENKVLTLTRLRATKEEIEGLMTRILRYARDHALDGVEVWNLAPDLEKALSKFPGSRIEREEHYPAIKWYRDESVEWMFNERFCWC